ncbi:4-(cytidine 5'-diphospho)-2-C-methyl-D-erythritol kinase [Emcibacter sp. SYSU 3D8]|uniref:4-(cytidine 5'-diphospho)-2-C-methyl-D-erythritol kinase n=1 Tax=Emcibacter sp. SYSU 3D8 TaxID=3133969 RepID=UPI0031FE5525
MTVSADGPLIETAWAKLNLYLHVTAIRENGYHELDSLFAFVGVGDRLTVTPAADIDFAVDGPFAAGIPEGGDNLVVRAARVLSPNGTPGARITLTKNLPVASGIGGGSADAAATLRALNTLWRLDLPAKRLERIAEGLGADVPACVGSVPVQVSGIGEILAPAAALPECWVVLVNPGVAVSTPAVFRRFDADVTRFRAPAPIGPSGTAAELAAALAERANDLEPAARAMAPVIGEALALIRDTAGCLLARMSGSGATCFGLYASESEAGMAAARVADHNPSWWAAHGALRGGGA